MFEASISLLSSFCCISSAATPIFLLPFHPPEGMQGQLYKVRWITIIADSRGQTVWEMFYSASFLYSNKNRHIDDGQLHVATQAG